MKVLRVYTGADARSHLEDVEIPLPVSHAYGQMSELHEGEGVIFRETPADYDAGFHNAPRRQYVVILAGTMEIETGDGSKRRLGPGGILLGEDTSGEGHITRAVGGVPGKSLFIPLE
jgi:hypothetical protein